MLFLEATAEGDWYDVIGRVRAAIAACGVVLGERPFSGVLVTFHFDLYPEKRRTLAQCLAEQHVFLDAGSTARLNAPAGTSTEAMLAVRLPQGDPDKKHPAPQVPG